MSKSKLSITEFFNLFCMQYKTIKNELQLREKYRIALIEKSEDKTHLKIAINGTGKEIVCLPEELAVDDNMLEGFSKKDIRLITYYACENLNKPKHKITATAFCQKLKKMYFRIKQFNSDHAQQKSAQDISNDKTILSNLSPEDAHRIGYVVGSEDVLNEQAEKFKLSLITNNNEEM